MKCDSSASEPTMSSRIPWLSPLYISLTKASTSAGSFHTTASLKLPGGSTLRNSVLHDPKVKNAMARYILRICFISVQLEGQAYTNIVYTLLRVHRSVLIVGCRIEYIKLVRRDQVDRVDVDSCRAQTHLAHKFGRQRITQLHVLQTNVVSAPIPIRVGL